MNQITKTFFYEASSKWNWPIDISLQDFSITTRDILKIITHAYEPLEVTQERIYLEGNERSLESIAQDQNAGNIFNFSAEIPFKTHKSHGTIRVKPAEGDGIEKYASYMALGVFLSFIPPIIVTSEKMNPYTLLWSLVPAITIVAPNIYLLSREEQKRRVKIIELEFHAMERKNTGNGRIKDLFHKLEEYHIPTISL
ncbi:MAG: hypothetical protein Q8R18_03875 [bacterium]|nr:hypothetical protein [bacterium]